MSPDLIDQTILANCSQHFRKVARIVGEVAIALKVPMEQDKGFIQSGSRRWSRPGGCSRKAISTAGASARSAFPIPTPSLRSKPRT
jgi:hypothetical protein